MDIKKLQMVVWCAYQSSALGILTVMLLWATFQRGNALAALLTPAALVATVTAMGPVARMIREEIDL